MIWLLSGVGPFIESLLPDSDKGGSNGNLEKGLSWAYPFGPSENIISSQTFS